MLGFLVTALAVILSLGSKEFNKNYSHFGFFEVFGTIYIFTLLTLLGTFVLATITVVYHSFLPLLLAFAITNIAQFLVISVTSYNLMFKK